MQAAGGKPSPWQGGSMNPNLYATKKTVAQGLLDVALLSVNATQLKQLLQLGPQHDFYVVMITLISVSIVLQILVGIVFMALGFLNVNKEKNQRSAEILNNLATAAVFAVTVLNILTASFDMRHPEAAGGPRYAALP
ncbi:unnamed protein product [Ixodes hexagonus]